MNYVSWGDAARFVNWLSNGQPSTAVEDLSTTEDGSYYLNGATNQAALQGVSRRPGASWVLPSDNEWYKAAYYDPNKPGGAGYWVYPTRSDSPPSNDLVNPDAGNSANYRIGDWDFTLDYPYYRTSVGEFENSASPYGTYDQAGNVVEWTDTIKGFFHNYRGAVGGVGGTPSDDLASSGIGGGSIQQPKVAGLVFA